MKTSYMTMVERKESDYGWRVERKKRKTVTILIDVRKVAVIVVVVVEVIAEVTVDITTVITTDITISCIITLFV